MPKVKPPEFEDRPAITVESNPADHFPPGASYSLAFSRWFLSWLRLLCPFARCCCRSSATIRLAAPKSRASEHFASWFPSSCKSRVLGSSVIHPHTRRAHVYFWSARPLFPLCWFACCLYPRSCHHHPSRFLRRQSRLTTRSSERRLAGASFLYSESCVASLRR